MKDGTPAQIPFSSIKKAKTFYKEIKKENQ